MRAPFREYAMNYVLSGEMVLDDGHRQIHVGKESACSFRATIRVTMYKESLGRRAVCNLHVLYRSFLREMYGKYARHTDKGRTHVEGSCPA